MILTISNKSCSFTATFFVTLLLKVLTFLCIIVTMRLVQYEVIDNKMEMLWEMTLWQKKEY